MLIRNGRKIGHGGLDLGPADPPTIERADADFLHRLADNLDRFCGPTETSSALRSVAIRVRTTAYETHANGKPKWAPDGTLLDDKGNRSLFDDVDA